MNSYVRNILLPITNFIMAYRYTKVLPLLFFLTYSPRPYYVFKLCCPVLFVLILPINLVMSFSDQYCHNDVVLAILLFTVLFSCHLNLRQIIVVIFWFLYVILYCFLYVFCVS